MYEVDEQTKKKICKMFGKTEQEANEDVKNIRKWLETQPHLPEIMEEKKIRNMFNLCKFDIEKTKRNILNYYTVRSIYSGLFKNINPKSPHMKKLLETTHYSMFPKPLDGVHRVIFIGPKEPNTFVFLSISKMLLNLMELRLYEDYMVDDIFIADFKNLTFRDICTISPGVLYRIYKVYQTVFSIRMYKVYFINSPSYIGHVMKLLKYILPKKLYDRFEVSPDDKILKDIFSKNELPQDYGGKGLSLEELDEMFRKKLDEYQERFDLLDVLRVH